MRVQRRASYAEFVGCVIEWIVAGMKMIQVDALSPTRPLTFSNSGWGQCRGHPKNSGGIADHPDTIWLPVRIIACSTGCAARLEQKSQQSGDSKSYKH